LQQRQDLAVGFAELADAQVGQLEHFLDADTGVPQRLDGRPGPEPLDLLPDGVDPLGFTGGGQADGAGIGAEREGQSGVVLVVQGECFAGLRGSGAVEQLDGPAVPAAGEVAEAGHQRGEGAGAALHALGGAAALRLVAADVTDADGARHRPRSPPGGLFMGPGGDVEVEAADGAEDAVGVAAGSAIGFGLDALFPTRSLFGSQRDGAQAGVVVLQVPPEQVDQDPGGVVQAAVVAGGTHLGDVVDEQPTDGGIGDPVTIDELGGSPLSPQKEGVEAVRGVAQQSGEFGVVPQRAEIAARPSRGAQTGAEVQDVLGGDVVQADAVVNAEADEGGVAVPGHPFADLFLLADLEQPIPTGAVVVPGPVPPEAGLLEPPPKPWRHGL